MRDSARFGAAVSEGLLTAMRGRMILIDIEWIVYNDGQDASQATLP